MKPPAAELVHGKLAILATALFVCQATATWGQSAGLFRDLLAPSTESIRIDADSLERVVVDGRDVLVYRGDVVAFRRDVTIRADELRVISAAAGGGAFDRIEALGNVSVVLGVQRAVARTAVLDMGAQIATMTGQVVLGDGSSRVFGEVLTVDTVTGDWRLEPGSVDGRVRAILTPGS